MPVPYDPRFNKNKKPQTFICGFCSTPFKELGEMLLHEDSCQTSPTPVEEVKQELNEPTKNSPAKEFKILPRISNHISKLPYGYGKK